VYGNKVFVSDCFNSRIICLDSSYNLIKTFGSPGRGPGEFVTPDQLAVVNDSLYAFDTGTGKILVFTVYGKYCREFYLKECPNVYTRVTISKNGNIFVSTPLLDNSITVYDLNGNIKYGFGNLNKSMGYSERLRSLCNLQLYNNEFLFAVAYSRPEIKIYGLTGKLISEVDLSNMSAFSNLLKYFNKNNRQGLHSVIPDVSIFKDDLYLLSASITKGYYYKNLVIKCKFKQTQIIPDCVFTLVPQKGELGKYMYIGVNSNSIIAFTQSNQSLDIFQY
jgi:WD40 repeat protein